MMTNYTLTDDNKKALMLIKSNCIRKRLEKELKNIYTLFGNVKVVLNEEELLKISICEIKENKLYKYDFVIVNNYPFISPKIYYQNRPYQEFVKTQYSKTLIDIMKKVTGNMCFCCSSYVCHCNWSPHVTIVTIIEEINSIRNSKRNIINKICADKIKKKYLVDDINLDGWLF